ncbi:putative sulfate exporter family transporter [Singulisphaera sp. PoT]|uniref:putative sulfate exporter family transporter n=1 Tax=Singulisphaera sp. PoT TaxID=3411797 RepID=UPI003BF4EFD3
MRSWFASEDWFAVWLGLAIVLIALPTGMGFDLLGWVASPKVWLVLENAVKPVSAKYAGVSGTASLLFTFLLLFTLLGICAAIRRIPLRSFLPGFAVIYWLSVGCWLLGHYAYIAETPNKRAALGISWSLGLTGEAGFLVALLAGLFVGNVLPGVAARLQPAARAEWFIKTAIVLLGAGLGVKAAASSSLVTSIMFRGLAAIIEAYLIYWSIVYFIARRFFKFSREWAAPLASGISICGVSAAITTGAAIRARPVVPIMVSSLVVIFSVVELVALPIAAREFLWKEPMVAAAWMGLAVKTDGSALASGAITESLIHAKALENGINYEAEWMLTTTTTVKVFIDLFIGVWAMILSLVWAYGIQRESGEKPPIREVLKRFPAFVLGYFALFLAFLGMTLAWPSMKVGFAAATAQTDPLRGVFFAMTFFTIGMASDLKRLWAEGIGKLALVYIISLFGFIIWIGLAISWLFFHGAHPPIISGGP